MIEQTVAVKTADGSMETFIVHPERNGPFPVVLYMMDAPGIREELRDFARRLATAGYYVMLPQLYYRAGGPWQEIDFSNEADLQRMYKLYGSMNPTMVSADAGALLEYAGGDKQAMAAKAGAVGFCMSGGFVLAMARDLGPKLSAVASIHPGGLVTDRDDSPHLNAGSIKAEVYAAIADKDEHAPPEHVEILAEAYRKAGVTHEFEDYPGATHPFTFPSLPGYNKQASERHWERVHALFDRCLRR